jgi:hypothetical protein
LHAVGKGYLVYEYAHGGRHSVPGFGDVYVSVGGYEDVVPWSVDSDGTMYEWYVAGLQRLLTRYESGYRATLCTHRPQ